MHLTWHRYKYYPYEKELALREIKSLLQPDRVDVADDGVHVYRPKTPKQADRLAYFSTVSHVAPTVPTKQGLFERVDGNGPSRQSTRYSVHGLHDYKGKFNPQVVKSMLNIFGAKPGQLALDPFCGSGTSLIECAHLGIASVGIDINPLAVFVANAKLDALATPSTELLTAAMDCLRAAKRSRERFKASDERGDYLRSWFAKDYLSEIERLRSAIASSTSKSAHVLLSIASNLLRDYSMQEPSDLRIRRRKSPYPESPFFDAFEKASRAFCAKLADTQATTGVIVHRSRAVQCDSRSGTQNAGLPNTLFDVAVTSPPYATALPYIDTQRLSLVWLGLVPPSEILTLEAELVGSREIRGQKKVLLLSALETNNAALPDHEVEFCRRLQKALKPTDGFRRQLVPRLLYRYFADMNRSFGIVRALMKDKAKFGLIVGGNHTVLGGTRFDINTPAHLASIAGRSGWSHVESVPLQTYQRFGLHAANATTTEALLILQAR
jgi:site-specific DNA-methyltransferase (cytosine-N4-specific)